jgi:hypothetical protein
MKTSRSEDRHTPLGCTVRALCEKCKSPIHRLSRLVHANRQERQTGAGIFATGVWTHTNKDDTHIPVLAQ